MERCKLINALAFFQWRAHTDEITPKDKIELKEIFDERKEHIIQLL